MKKMFVFILLILVIQSGFTQNNFSELVQISERAVVTVKTYAIDGTPLKVGTAFIIDESGILLSNFHVFSDSYSAKIFTIDSKEYDVNKIVSSNKELDLIKFSVSNPLNSHFPKLAIASSPPLKGEDIFVIGSPGGFESSVSKGIISAIRDIPQIGKLYQITAPISSGSSGSPVCNMQGKVVGIATLQYQEGQNINFALDINLIKRLTDNTQILVSAVINTPLPEDNDDAMKLIDDTFILSEKLVAINAFISKYPNDYRGYLKRALVYTNWLYSPEGATKENFKQKMIESLALSDKDFTKALQLSSNKSIVYFYRGIAKYNQREFYSPQLIGWDINSALSDLNKCNSNEIGFKNGSQGNCNKFEYIGDIKYYLTDYVGALAAYKQALINYPQRNKIYQLYGQIAKVYYYDFQDNKNAFSSLNKAFASIDESNIKNDHSFNSWDLFILRAEIKTDMDDLSGALADINKVFAECSCMENINAYNYFLKATIIYNMDGDLYQVISSLNKALEYQSDENTKALYYDLRSTIYLLTKQYQSALIDKNKFFEITPLLEIKATDYLQRSEIKEKLMDYTGALKDINKAIELDFKNASFYYRKGSILYDLKDKIGAIKAFDKAIQLDPKEIQYYIMRGFAKYDSDKMGACADWSKAGEMGDYSAYDLIEKYCK
jgi:tetratricopeptide (TPR) repeat protein